jgi:hypothetical protein
MATEIPQPTPAIITATAEEEEEQGIEAVRLVVASICPHPSVHVSVCAHFYKGRQYRWRLGL